MSRPRYSFYWVHVRSLLEHQIQEFKEYSELIETSMKQRHDDLLARYRKDMEDANPEQKENVADFYAEDGQKLANKFPQYFRQSLFLTVYSFLEQQLAFFSKHYERKHEDRIQLGDLNHKGITQYSVYLTKVIGVAFPASSSSWQQILKYNKLRNQLVHVGPQIGRTPQAKNLKRTISQLPGVSVNKRSEISLDGTCCDTAIECVEDLFKALFGVLPKD